MASTTPRFSHSVRVKLPQNRLFFAVRAWQCAIHDSVRSLTFSLIFRRTYPLAFVVALLAAGLPAWCQSPVTSVNELAEVDSDYAIQGEYFGSFQREGCCQAVGLQVVAMGDGNFEALVYRGGLPGNGFDGSSRLKLKGSRLDPQVVLGGENLVVILQVGYAATVQNLYGERLGVLQRVKRSSATLGAVPPANAIVLFDGRNTDQLKNARVTADHLLEIGCETKDAFQNFTLHAEFRTPYMPHARGQNRGNSGFYLQKRYEVQVLDSFGLESKYNDCGAIYTFKAPDLNMCFPPLHWQTYDITFRAPRFSSDSQKITKGQISVSQNGLMIHRNLELEHKTGGGSLEGPNPLPILLQNHGNPVHFRNLWIVDHDRGFECLCLPACAISHRPSH